MNSCGACLNKRRAVLGWHVARSLSSLLNLFIRLLIVNAMHIVFVSCIYSFLVRLVDGLWNIKHVSTVTQRVWCSRSHVDEQVRILVVGSGLLVGFL